MTWLLLIAKLAPYLRPLNKADMVQPKVSFPFHTLFVGSMAQKATISAGIGIGCFVIYSIYKSFAMDKSGDNNTILVNAHNIQSKIKEINDNHAINDNIDCAEIIKDFLYLSDYEFGKDIDKMQEIGIERILNCGGKGLEMEFSRIKWPKNFKRKVINAIDADGYPIIDKHGETAFKFINKCKKNNKKVLVHCRSGVNRSATIVVGYLIKHENINILDAINQVREKRQIPILSNATFNQQLLKLAIENGKV